MLVFLGPVQPMVAVSALLAMGAVDRCLILAVLNPVCARAANFLSIGAAC